MNPIFKNTLKIIDFTGNIRKDVYHFLVMNGCPKTAVHSLKVGNEAKRIAEMVGYDGNSAQKAGCLHDISAVYPSKDRIDIARILELNILEEERKFPMIIHQKISMVMAKELFNIQDIEILNAVGCHTTLKSNATMLDLILFVADKIQWDQDGEPPYLMNVLTKLEMSLEHAVFEYIDYLWQRRNNLRVIHPWLKEAYYDLKSRL